MYVKAVRFSCSFFFLETHTLIVSPRFSQTGHCPSWLLCMAVVVMYSSHKAHKCTHSSMITRNVRTKCKISIILKHEMHDSSGCVTDYRIGRSKPHANALTYVRRIKFVKASCFVTMVSRMSAKRKTEKLYRAGTISLKASKRESRMGHVPC